MTQPTCSSRSDDGFSLIELIVAMMVITGVLLVLMAVQTSALVTTAQSRQRTQATAVSNQIMEELRALPWLVLNKGLHPNFAAAAGGDANISSGRFRPTVGATLDETLVTTSTQATDVPPLSGTGGSNKVISVDPSNAATVFTSRVYVTRSAATQPNVLTLTVVTTWTRSGRTTTGFVVTRTEAYAPAGGCGDVSNQPFLGACQALFSSSGGADGPSVTVTGGAAGPSPTPAPVGAVPVLPGSPVITATMSLGKAGSSVSSQQASTTDSQVTQAGVLLQGVDPEVPIGTDGFAKVLNSASNDVGASGAAPASPPDSTGVSSSASLSAGSGPYTLSFAAGGGVSGVAKASTTTSCATGIPSAQPCGAATVTGGTPSSVSFSVGATTMGVVSVAGGGTSKTFGARFGTTAGGVPVGCTVLTGSGCASAGAERTVGTMSFGTAAWVAGSAPNGLVRVTGYHDSARVERGVSQPVVDGVATRSGLVSYWNGTAYTDLTLGPLTNQTAVSAPVTWTAAGVTVTAQATVVITPSMSIASNPDVACKTDGCAIDTSAGDVTVAVTYTLTDATGSTAFTAATSLGTSHVNASYKAAPDA
ncbi:prepilin-type N-terminal cleavage/methylation domain-containing protein [Cellulomonas sp. P22]|uniref:prepilin-type N-terminal cleavage/methylation domain-containing protein n=1 Tax=Cellulomonas sp. P22 TaxID=3373189 RepID=UPI00378B9442